MTVAAGIFVMGPVDIDWLATIREFGLPLVMLVLFAAAILVRRGKRISSGREVPGSPLLVPGSQVDDLKDEIIAIRTEASEELAAVRQSRDKREDHMRREMETAVGSWQQLYQQERGDRLKSDDRLTIATSELKEVTSRVEDLTKEVIRSARR